MKAAHYPALYTASDAASLAAQRTYFWLLRTQLASFILSSIGSALAVAAPKSARTMFATATAVVLALTLILLWISRWRRDEKIWFDCRAIAESVKTATWRYMMRSPPFDDQNLSGVERRFLDELNEIRQARPNIGPHLVRAGATGAEVTAEMRTCRAMPLDERKRFYVTHRVRDQKTWYEKKCNDNQQQARQWFWVVAILQFAALALAIVQVAYAPPPVNLISLLMTLAASSVAWSQAKRHEDLVEPYALAAQELSSLEALAEHMVDEPSFKEFVTQTEESVSREHTMWCARRNITLGGRRQSLA